MAIAELLGHPNQVNRRFCLHLPHDVTALNLDGDLTRPELGGDLSVELPSDHLAHYLALALREHLEPLPQYRNFRPLLPSRPVPFECLLYRVEQILIPKRLGQKLHGAGLHGLYRHRNVTVPRDENNGDANIQFGEFTLEIKPAEPGQSNVEHQAIGSIRRTLLQELLRGNECLGSQPDGFHDARDSVTDGDIIVDYKNRRLIFAHRRSPVS